MSAWHGFNVMFYGVLVFWSVPAAVWWIGAILRLFGPARPPLAPPPNPTKETP